MTDDYRAILIAGPTASGKSAAALALAERLGGCVINADSMQVYKDLRILTARPDARDEARIPHALYGFLACDDAYSVGRWIKDVEREIAEAGARGEIPIVTGGTGLYFKALLEGLSPVPDIPERVRRRWRRIARETSGPELHEMLSARDRVMAERLHPSDPQRIARALEVIEATGKSLAEWQQQPGKGLLRTRDCLRIVVAPEREILAERINARFARMIDAGALDEVRALAARTLDPGLPIMRALGVAPLIEHLRGHLDRAGALETVATQTRQYAKRQRTWAKSNMITWNWIIEKDSESLVRKIFSFVDV